MNEQIKSNRVYISKIVDDKHLKHIESELSSYGNVIDKWIAFTLPGFGFFHFENVEDAEKCVEMMDGSFFEGKRIRVELTTKSMKPSNASSRGRLANRYLRPTPYDRNRDSFQCRNERHIPRPYNGVSNYSSYYPDDYATFNRRIANEREQLMRPSPYSHYRQTSVYDQPSYNSYRTPDYYSESYYRDRPDPSRDGSYERPTPIQVDRNYQPSSFLYGERRIRD